MIKLMDMAFILIQMGQDMKDIGKKISRMEVVKKVGPMVLLMKVNINKEKKVGKEFLNGQMVVHTMGNLKIIILMDKVLIHGEIEGSIKENGKIIKWMEKVFLLGLMGENMMDNIKMIKKRDMEFLNGMMEKNIEGSGLMENKMEKENFIIVILKLGKNVLSKMERK